MSLLQGVARKDIHKVYVLKYVLDYQKSSCAQLLLCKAKKVTSSLCRMLENT